MLLVRRIERLAKKAGSRASSTAASRAVDPSRLSP